MGIFVTGDCHGDFRKLYTFAQKMELTEQDSIIILGDMGMCWRYDKIDYNELIKTWEEHFKAHIFWLDGNHENFNLINKITKDKNNGLGYCSEHIHYVPRGTVIDFDGIKCLFMRRC